MIEKRQPLVSELSRRRKLGLFARHLAPGSRVLEIGCGDGWFTRRLRAAGHEVVGVDLVGPADIVGDVREWPTLGLAAGSFDAAVALEVIEHVDCLEALTSLCKPGGIIFLSSPHPSWDWVMRLLEQARLTQRRTSPHRHLVDFSTIPLEPLRLQRPMWIHQVGIFRNLARQVNAA